MILKSVGGPKQNNKPAPQQQNSQAVSLDSLKTTIKQESDSFHPATTAAKESGAQLITDLEKFSTQKNVDEVRQALSQKIDGANTRANVGMWAYGLAGVATLAGGFVAAAAGAPIQTALGIVGGSAAAALASAGLTAFSEHQANSAQATLDSLNNWAEYSQNKANVPARPQLASPIPQEDFLAQAKQVAEGPHPHQELVKDDVARFEKRFSRTYNSDSRKLEAKLENEVKSMGTEQILSYVSLLAGAGLTIGSAVAAVTGHIPPAVALGLSAGGYTLSVHGAKSIEKQQVQQAEADYDLGRLKAWNQYMEAPKKAS